MTTADTGADPTWGILAERDEPERTAAVQARYTELAALPEDERRSRLRAMMQSEYALADAPLRTMTLARLRALLSMDADASRVVVASLDSVMNTLPGSAAMRRVSLVQTLAPEFSPDEQHELRERMPSVFGDRPRTEMLGGGAPATPLPERPAKPWWAFWRK